MIKTVIFDLDGTLLDTGKGIINSVKYTLEEFGFVERDEDVLASFVGPPIAQQLKKIYGMSEKDATEAMRVFREKYGKGDIFVADQYVGLEDTLKELRENGVRLAVATYKREDMAIQLLENKGIACYFDCIHGSDKEGKLTKHEIVELCIHDLGGDRNNTILIGDSENDAIGAENAEIDFVGALYGYGFKTETEVEKYSNIGVVHSCDEILDIVLKRN